MSTGFRMLHSGYGEPTGFDLDTMDVRSSIRSPWTMPIMELGLVLDTR